MSIRVNPKILVWARQTAGFDVDDAARKLGFKDSSRSTAIEKLELMETGEKQPSRAQISKFADAYKRPLLTFYLSEPPKTGKRGQDFRQTPEMRGRRDNAMLDALLRDVKARQESVRDILLDEDGFKPHEFVGSTDRRASVLETVKSIAKQVNFDNTDISLRSGDADSLFRRLRTAIESAGVFVMVLGNLGNYRTAIGSSVFRGFAISDDIAPFIVINASDAKPARSFTLMHELAHIWLGQTGVSGNVSLKTPASEHAKVERFCNDVAGEFLLPDAHFKKTAPNFNPDDLEAARECIDIVAARWSVSEPMVALRLHRRGELSAGAYEKLRTQYHARWQAKLQRDKDNRSPDATGPNGHIMKQFNVGTALVDVVHRAVRGNTLTHSKAGALLGSKPGAVEPFLRQFEDKRRSFRSSGKVNR